MTLTFEDGNTVRIPIIAGQCLREGWHYLDESLNTTISEIEASGSCKNVFAERQERGELSAIGVIDMITLPIPEPVKSLKQIDIEDTSVNTVGSMDPSIIIIAITVQIK